MAACYVKKVFIFLKKFRKKYMTNNATIGLKQAAACFTKKFILKTFDKRHIQHEESWFRWIVIEQANYK